MPSDRGARRIFGDQDLLQALAGTPAKSAARFAQGHQQAGISSLGRSVRPANETTRRRPTKPQKANGANGSANRSASAHSSGGDITSSR
jgi:hypothetical protein